MVRNPQKEIWFHMVDDSWLDSWGAGRETLQLAGEDYIEADIEGYDIEEV